MHELTSAVDESIDIAEEEKVYKHEPFMKSYLKGDIELVGGNGAFRRTEQGKTTKQVQVTTEDDIVKELENDGDYLNELLNAFEEKG